VDLGRFFSFLNLYTVGRTPWTGDQPVARPLPAHITTQTQNKRTQRPSHISGGYSLTSHGGGPDSSPGLVMWDLWWTEWLFGTFSSSTSVSTANLHSTSSTVTIICHLGLYQVDCLTPLRIKNAHRHPCLEWDPNPRSQCSRERRRFMP
jgi:hypothetical protein